MSRALAVALVAVVLPGCAGGPDHQGAAGSVGGISVENVVVWPTADMATLGMRATAREDDALVEVRVGLGGSATMHTVGPAGRGMSEVAEVVLPEGREVVLTVGNPHVMILGLERELRAGDSLDVIFRFRRAGELSLMVPVARYTEAVRMIGPP
ncbi:MAG TPA: copper chaperone PCu(A)C [Gemmatimonadales bacterium]|nr:copper chaperone PCu(A)C [Gemmatimonadales bacterium]